MRFRWKDRGIIEHSSEGVFEPTLPDSGLPSFPSSRTHSCTAAPAAVDSGTAAFPSPYTPGFSDPPFRLTGPVTDSAISQSVSDAVSESASQSVK